ncbi:MAG: hypothetical protein ACT4RN_13160 [Pseudonocardia sp.]
MCRGHGPAFASPVHVSGLLTDLAPLEAGLRDAVRGATTRTGPEDRSAPRLRVYEGHRLDYMLVERWTDSAFDGADLEAWFNRLAPPGDVCLAFNEIDAWSPLLADLLAREVTRPLADAVGEPRSGLEWYSFVGRSGWTPFGVHHDPEPSLIFHLGPAPKTVWIWDPADLAELPHGRRVTLEFAHLLPRARHVIELRAGDFLAIPAFHLHVFRNLGYAAFLGLTIFPQDLRQELANVVMHLAPATGPGYRDAEDARGLIRAGALAVTGSAERAADVAHALDVAERRLRSTAWTRKPTVPAPSTPDERVAGTWFAVTARPVVPAPAGARPGLFVGGRRVGLPAGSDPDALGRVLAPGRTMRGDDLLGVLAGCVGSASARALLRALETCGGVRSLGGAAR